MASMVMGTIRARAEIGAGGLGHLGSRKREARRRRSEYLTAATVKAGLAGLVFGLVMMEIRTVDHWADRIENSSGELAWARGLGMMAVGCCLTGPCARGDDGACGLAVIRIVYDLFFLQVL
ncbi:hypothetical protein M0R45_030792 [Rubus argutus]|uniref:Uncharacterized protein n=1 Tax=Rubus argutus TaxID=59490 RepID=A0AAW1WE48_RUBAR